MFLTTYHAGKTSLVPICTKWEAGIICITLVHLFIVLFECHLYFIKYTLLSLQVKAANKLLKTIPQDGVRKKVDGVPVFSAQNLDIAIATKDGIKWCMLLVFFVTCELVLFSQLVDMKFSISHIFMDFEWKDTSHFSSEQ